MSEMQSRDMRRYAAFRSALIGYGVVAFAFFPPTRALMLWGVGAQIAVIVLRKLIERQVRDPAMAGTALMVLEIVGDGVTVALFAIATLGGIMRVEDQV
jgi:voltage-gated potassium channel Kch